MFTTPIPVTVRRCKPYQTEPWDGQLLGYVATAGGIYAIVVHQRTGQLENVHTGEFILTTKVPN